MRKGEGGLYTVGVKEEIRGKEGGRGVGRILHSFVALHQNY